MMKTVTCEVCRRPFTFDHRRGSPRKRCDDHHGAYVKKAAPKQPPLVVPKPAAQQPVSPDPALPPRLVTCTSETEYTADELEFIKAVDKFRRERKRPYPTATELLGVARQLGYRKVVPGA